MVLVRARLASTLLALCWAAALTGCLLSQEDRVLTDPPNRPPRIMEELPTLTPDKDHRLTLVNGPDCPVLTFGFSAEDPDVSQPLNVRWYVDYPQVRVFVLDNEQVLAPSSSGRPQRDDQGSQTVDLASPALVPPLSQLQLHGPHIVEAVLFDFHLDANRNPVPISVTDGGITNPSYAVSYAWVVDMERTCPPPP